jgi:hypothetical protein
MSGDESLRRDGIGLQGWLRSGYGRAEKGDERNEQEGSDSLLTYGYHVNFSVFST